MKVLICPKCGSITAVSRRKEVECYKCGGTKMISSKLPFAQYAEMDENERKSYAKSWLYIRQRSGFDE